jgi:hypothetical protein
MANRTTFYTPPTTPGDPDAWLALPVAEFVDSDDVHHSFTAVAISEHFSLRVAPRARPYQRGAKLDQTSHNPDEFDFDLIFHADVTEPGADFDRWPGAKQSFLDAAHKGETGTLNLPWKRGIRCKVVDATATARSDEYRGGECVRTKFLADNEDDLDRAAFVAVSVKAALSPKVDAAQFDMESEGMDLGSIEDVTELAADVVGLLNAPADQAAALLHAGNRLRRAVLTVTNAFSTNQPGRDQMNDPQGSSARLKLLELAELGARAVGEARPKATRTVSFTRMRDIWSIATELGANARELMTINEQIEDFSAIPAGVPVRVFV